MRTELGIKNLKRTTVGQIVSDHDDVNQDMLGFFFGVGGGSLR